MKEMVLRRAIFGGYKEKDVFQYLSFDRKKYEQKQKELELKISLLISENTKLRSKAVVYAPENLLQTAEEDVNLVHELESRSIDQKTTNYNTSNARLQAHDTLSTPEMNLPEGIYLVSPDHKLVGLPEPKPVYQTEQSNSMLDTVVCESVQYPPLEEEQQSPPRIAEESENSFSEYTTEAEKENPVYFEDTTRNEVKTKMVQSKKDFKTDQEHSKSAAKEVEQKMKTTDQLLLPHRVVKMDAIITSLNEQLKTVKQSNQELQAKLEYSTELLLRIYQQ